MKAIKQIFLLLIPLLLTACVREIWPEQNGASDEWVIPFSVDTPSDVVISTKSAMTVPATEQAVYNLYVLVFDREVTADETTDPPTVTDIGKGNKVFGHFFDSSNKFNTVAAANSAGYTNKNYWVWNGDGTGLIHLKSSKSSPFRSAKCTIVAIANLNSEMVNITPEQLGLITNWSEMVTVPAKLLQQITSRSGYFPMSGVLDNVDMSGNTFTTQSISLERLDSKIHFNVRAEAGHGIENFTPVSWQVINVPIHSSVLSPSDGGEDAATTTADFFSGEEMIFETEEIPAKPSSGTDTRPKYTSGKIIPTHGFSFYMMENTKTPKEGCPADADWTYADRDLQIKTSNNKNTGSFKYANDLATYVILKGRLVIADEDGHKNHAEVRYVIHLGSFGSGTTESPWKYNDFDVERNLNYTYNIFIQGVEHIRAEVTTGTEAEPGASGQIVVPVRQIFTCDSHYSTHTLEFTEDDFKIPDGESGRNLSWWVRTPFTDDLGTRSNTDGTPGDTGIDYKWVEFRVNFDQRNEDDTYTYKAKTWTRYIPHGDTPITSDLYTYIVNPNQEGNTYFLDPASDTPVKTSPTMYIDELMAFLAAAKDGDVTIPNGGKPVFDGNKKIVVTAFVNEYYYEKDPTIAAAGYDPTLWRRFINAPMRTMCILSSSDRSSLDGESIEERATYIIQQHSIQSVYNVKSQDLNIGWGAEYMTDDRELKFYGQNNVNQYWSPATEEKRGNTNPNNGRWDTMIEWGLRTASNASYLGHDMSWSTYINLTDGDDTHAFMTDDYKYLRYDCMSRNRDNDGDGKIDKEEVRWYMAASYQLINLYLGSYGIESSAALYQRSVEDREKGKDGRNWRHHIIGSDCATFGGDRKSDINCRIIWAEEGPTGSWFNAVNGQNNALLTVRCVRNFGQDNDVATRKDDYGGDVTYSSEDATPDPLIVVKQYHRSTGKEATAADWNNWNNYKDIYLDVDCSRMNEKSLRYYTDRELAPHDEFNEAACLYKHFQAASVAESVLWTDPVLCKTINENIDASGKNEYCPDGYRLPNIRELGVMCYFFGFDKAETYVRSSPATSGLNNFFTFSRTRFSFGSTGKNYDKDGKWGWAMGRQTYFRAITANNSNHTTLTTRCVKDVKVETTSTTTP